mmetsp:Transcript_5970/g.15119  ORF Transcript_5970/g.15119 Transcript_5970/m.15119 type:complete len:345 (-) Transcript_5970:10-1044(-)
MSSTSRSPPRPSSSSLYLFLHRKPHGKKHRRTADCPVPLPPRRPFHIISMASSSSAIARTATAATPAAPARYSALRRQRRACVVSASLRDNRKGAPHVTTCLAGSQAAMLAVGMAFGVGALPIGAAEAKPLFAIAIKELGGETVGLSIEKSEDGSIQVKQLPMDAAPEVKTVAEEVPAEESAVATEVEQDVVVVAAEVESTEEEAAPAVAEVLPEPDVEVVAEVEPAEQEPPTAIAEVVPEPEAIELVAEAESTGQEAQAAGAEVVEPAAVVVAELEPNLEETAPSVADLATPEAAVAVSEVKPVDQANLPVVAELVDESDNSGSLILVGGEMAEGEAQVRVPA